MASNLRVTELDFFQIRENFKNYLKAQQDKGKFVDYDFDGSGMAVLLDILAYNTHYNAVNANMSLNEVFLDSAERRNNVVSLAKMLAYVPRSTTSSFAEVDITVSSPIGSPSTLTLDRGVRFTTTLNDEQYSFVNLESKTIVPVGGVYEFTSVILKEGTLREIEYTVDSFDKGLYFEVPDENVDISTLIVKVKQNSGSTLQTVYSLATDLVTINDQSQVYFLQEGIDGRYEVYFGDGIVGKALEGGNVVILEWLSTNQAEANGATTFTLADTIDGNSNVNVVTITKSKGGAAKEDIDSIKFNAPLSYISQNRAVTADDYKAMITNNYGDIETIAVWGGEENNPPQYGKAYICIKPKTAEALSDIEKQYIVDSILRRKNVVSITPVIVDPQYTYLYLDVFFKYNPNLTDSTSGQLRTVVTNAISNYNDTILEKFDGVFRHSKLLGLIDRSDTGILNSTIRVYMEKRLVPVLNVKKRYELQFSGPILGTRNNPNEPVIKSTAFTLAGVTQYIEDRVLGPNDINPFAAEGATNVLQSYRIINNTKVVTNTAIGYVIADTGLVVIPSLQIGAIPDTYISFTCRPASDDIAPKREQLLSIDMTKVIVTPIIDTIATGSSNAGVGYTTVRRL